MKRNIILSAVLCFVLGVTVFAIETDYIQASIVDYKIFISGAGYINDSLQDSLISYNDRTYISIRDIGNFFNKNVNWDEKDKTISLYPIKNAPAVIKKPETALTIGKAITEEYCADRIDVNTMYHVGYTKTGLQREDFYCVYVMFNPPKDKEHLSKEYDLVNEHSLLENNDNLYIFNNSDVQVEISPTNGSFTINERQPDGKWKRIDA